MPVEKNADGLDVVPLKPISDVFGMDWESQRAKVQTPYLKRRLGTCTRDIPGADQRREMTCIRVDRVTAYLNQIDPGRVRSHGNELGADFLEQKQCEWDDVIHDYEMQRGTMLREVSSESKSLALSVRTYISITKAMKSTDDAEERRVLTEFARRVATEAGVPFQESLVP